MIRRLGVGSDVPMLGYAFRDDWAQHEQAVLKSFVAASREAKRILAGLGEAWARLAPQIGTDDQAVLTSLQSGFRTGIPERWGEAERKACADLHAILAGIGGETLVGKAEILDPRTFWPDLSY
jgi:NitT/TauT family transport system substrate-binding protein